MFPHHTASTADKQSVDVAREAFLAGETLELPGLRPEVRSAWVRSRAAGVDPELKHVPLLLEGPELHEYQRTHDIYRAGRHAARAAAALLKNTGCAIVLTDASGLVLYTGGDRSMLRHAERSAACRGPRGGKTWSATTRLGPRWSSGGPSSSAQRSTGRRAGSTGPVSLPPSAPRRAKPCWGRSPW